MENNWRFLIFADVHQFHFSHTVNCLEVKHKTSSPSSKLADNFYFSCLATGNIILALWSCTETLHIKLPKTTSACRKPSLQSSAIFDCSNTLVQLRRAFCSSAVNLFTRGFLKCDLIKIQLPILATCIQVTAAYFWCELMNAVPSHFISPSPQQTPGLPQVKQTVPVCNCTNRIGKLIHIYLYTHLKRPVICCPKSLTHQPEMTSVHMVSQQHLITSHDVFSREMTSFFMHVSSFFLKMWITLTIENKIFLTGINTIIFWGCHNTQREWII